MLTRFRSRVPVLVSLLVLLGTILIAQPTSAGGIQDLIQQLSSTTMQDGSGGQPCSSCSSGCQDGSSCAGSGVKMAAGLFQNLFQNCGGGSGGGGFFGKLFGGIFGFLKNLFGGLIGAISNLFGGGGGFDPGTTNTFDPPGGNDPGTSFDPPTTSSPPITSTIPPGGPTTPVSAPPTTPGTPSSPVSDASVPTDRAALVAGIKSKYGIDMKGNWTVTSLRAVYKTLAVVPASFRAHTKTITLMGNAGNMAGLAAVGGPWINIYSSAFWNDPTGIATIMHEMTHNYQGNGNVMNEWRRTIRGGSVTSYGNSNAGEDMAESVSHYYTRPAQMKASNPTRYNFVKDKIMGGIEFKGNEWK